MKRTTSSVITANIYHTSITKRVHFNEKETLQKLASQKIHLVKMEKEKGSYVYLWKLQCMSQEWYFCCCSTVTETYICVDWWPISTLLWVSVIPYKTLAFFLRRWCQGGKQHSCCSALLSDLCPGLPHKIQIHSCRGAAAHPPQNDPVITWSAAAYRVTFTLKFRLSINLTC